MEPGVGSDAVRPSDGDRPPLRPPPAGDAGSETWRGSGRGSESESVSGEDVSDLRREYVARLPPVGDRVRHALTLAAAAAVGDRVEADGSGGESTTFSGGQGARGGDGGGDSGTRKGVKKEAMPLLLTAMAAKTGACASREELGWCGCGGEDGGSASCRVLDSTMRHCRCCRAPAGRRRCCWHMPRRFVRLLVGASRRRGGATEELGGMWGKKPFPDLDQ